VEVAMKKLPIIFLVIICLCLFVILPALAYPNEPNGFRNIPWGTPKSQISGLFDCNSEGTSCSRINDNMTFGNASIYMIRYHFYKNMLESVSLTTKNRADSQALFNNLQANYGPGTKDEKQIGQYNWRGGTTLIDFVWNADGSAYVFMFSKAILELERYDKENAS
jgi:hypothetical protein